MASRTGALQIGDSRGGVGPSWVGAVVELRAEGRAETASRELGIRCSGRGSVVERTVMRSERERSRGRARRSGGRSSRIDTARRRCELAGKGNLGSGVASSKQVTARRNFGSGISAARRASVGEAWRQVVAASFVGRPTKRLWRTHGCRSLAYGSCRGGAAYLGKMVNSRGQITLPFLPFSSLTF